MKKNECFNGCTQELHPFREAVGRLAQLGRAPRLQRGGRGFKSPSVHHNESIPLSVMGSRSDLSRVKKSG
jgi:hypothetical protein